MTSSPGPMRSPASARWSAAVHELTARPCRAPASSAILRPSSSDLGPLVIQPESRASSTSAFSRSPIQGSATGSQVARTGAPPWDASAPEPRVPEVGCPGTGAPVTVGGPREGGGLQGLDRELPPAAAREDRARAARLMAGAWTVVVIGTLLFALAVAVYL